MTDQPGIPLEWVPEPFRAIMEEAAVTFRAKFKLPPDAPLRVILPKQLIPPNGQDAEVVMFADGSFVTSEEGSLDLGIERD